MPIMKRLEIEKLKRFDKKKMPFHKLIYQKYKPSWIFLGLLLLLTGLSFLGYFLIPLGAHKWWALLTSIPFLIFSILYVKHKTLLILKRYYNKDYKLNLTDKWSYDTIQTIRLKMFEKKIKSLHLNSPEQLKYIIEYLEYEYNSKKYNYTFSTTLTVLVLSALVSGFIAVALEKTGNWNEFYKLNKLFWGISIMLIFTIFYFDKYLLKEFILLYRNRNKRLILIIYNYMIKIA
jgi:hypothetical protein